MTGLCGICRASRPSAVASGLSHTLILTAALIAWSAAALGRRATIVPPADPPRPEAVYLIDYGRTSAVALPAGGAAGDRLVRYVDGDWNWYALRRTGSWPGVRALAWPTGGALGRGELGAPPRGEPEALRRGVDVQHVFELIVPGERVDRLRAELNAMHSELGASGPREETLASSSCAIRAGTRCGATRITRRRRGWRNSAARCGGRRSCRRGASSRREPQMSGDGRQRLIWVKTAWTAFVLVLIPVWIEYHDS